MTTSLMAQEVNLQRNNKTLSNINKRGELLQFTFFYLYFALGRDNPTAGGLSANGIPTKASPATSKGSPFLYPALCKHANIPPNRRNPSESFAMSNDPDAPRKVHPYAISVDWLQVYCYVDNCNIEEYKPLFPSTFEIVKEPYGTRQFRNVYTVYSLDREANNPIKHNSDYHYSITRCLFESKW